MNANLSGQCRAVVASTCTLPCESISSIPQTVCHRADAGTIAANAPFVIEGQTSASGTCSVTVDGGSSGPRFVKCNVLALPAGTYTVSSGTQVRFTTPESIDAGVPTCL